MASIISHAAAGAALTIAFAPDNAPARTWPVAIATSVSPFLGLMVSFLLTLLFFRDETVFSGRWFRYFLVFFLVWASHGVLDALTTGGWGVAFLSPFSSERYFFTWRPIRVSPMRMKSFFTPWGWSVVKNELVWIWLPGFILVFLSRLIRLK